MCYVLFHVWKYSPISILFKVSITLVLLALVGDLVGGIMAVNDSLQIALALCACFMMQLCIKTPPKGMMRNCAFLTG